MRDLQTIFQQPHKILILVSMEIPIENSKQIYDFPSSTMSDHTRTVFNNSCLKVPVNPVNKLPAPTYEQKYINQLQNQALKISSATEMNMKNKKSSKKETLKSLMDFYDSIPDYSDVNHLSNQEFYRKIENLKAKQKSYYEFLDAEYNIENKVETFVEDYNKQASGERSSSRKSENYKSNVKSWENYSGRRKDTPETDSVLSFEKEIPVNPPSRRSVRIESPKSVESKSSDREFNPRKTPRPRNVSSAGSKDSNKTAYSGNTWDDDNDNDNENLKLNLNTPIASRSLPTSPVKFKQNVNWKESGITIPKPFQMTIRDEEEQIVNEIIEKSHKPKEDKPEMFKAHPVPIESRIPLFDKIMEDQEFRRQIVKAKSKCALMSKMKPFSFTRREEELNCLTGRFSKSSPQLCSQLCSATYDEPELHIKPFKAKPVPKNLFSNYIYQKMHEDEFYRALKKKIRAEEMLKASSLPPSMAKREKTHKKHSICPRSYSGFESEPEDYKKKSPSPYQSRNQFDLELENLKNEFITTTPRPFKFATAKRLEKKRSRSAKKCFRASEYENTESKRAQSAMELQSVNRSNLAAVLRIQSARLNSPSSVSGARKRMELEMYRRLEEQKIKEEARWREKVMRQRPVWTELNYSHEEELAMRLQLRKEEEKLREQEHRHHMELMHGRVQQMPTLFERQSHVKPPKTRKELMQTLYDQLNYSPNLKQEIPDENEWEKLEQLYTDKAIQAKCDEDEKDSCNCSEENDN